MRLSPVALHGLQDLEILARGGELLDARFLQQIQERRAAAVHDRHFAMIELDDDIVDAGGDERGEQMLHRFHRRPRLAEHGRMLHARDLADRRRNVNAQVGAAEADAGVRGRRLEGERHLLARMQPDARARDLTFESPLFVHRLNVCLARKQSRCPYYAVEKNEITHSAATINRTCTSSQT